MAITKHVQHPKSSATTANTQSVTVPRLPSSGDLLYGEIAVNYRAGYETLSIKNSSNNIVGFTPNGHQIDATMTEGLSNGQIGMDANNVETFYIYHFEASRWRPLCNNYLADETELAGMPVVQDPQFVYLEDPGLMYYSVYDQSTTSQTWTAMATLNPINKRLADTQEPKVILDNFTSDRDYVVRSYILVFDDTANKLKQYGAQQIIEGVVTAELLYTYDPSKNVIYYKVGDDKAYRWNGSSMVEIIKRPTISASGNAISVSTNSISSTVTISSNIFSANNTTKAVTCIMPTGTSANTNNTSYYSLIYGVKNTVNRTTGATTFGSGNTIYSGANYSFAEGVTNAVSGIGAHAEGILTSAVGAASHSAGSGTVANNDAEFACGTYNTSTTGTRGTLFSVGYGDSRESKNAFEVRKDGMIYIRDSNGVEVCLQNELRI